MNPIEIKKLDDDCYKVLMDGEPLANKYNTGYFSKNDIQCLDDACSIMLIDSEMTDVQLGRSHIGEHGADDHRRQIEMDCED